MDEKQTKYAPALLLARLPEPARKAFQSLLAWPNESVGANMRHEYLAVREEDTVGHAKQLIHDAWDNAQLFRHIYVVNGDGRLQGSLSLKTLLIADPLASVATLMDRETVRINARADQELAARLLIDRDLLQDAYLCCHPCINTSTLKLRMADAIDVLIPALAHAPTYVDLPVYEPQT